MKLCIFIVFCWASINAVFAQDHGKEMPQSPSADQKLIDQSNQKVDSIQTAFFYHSDSLKRAYKANFWSIDSTQSRFQEKLDSIRALEASLTNAPKSKIDSIQAKLKTRVDSLTIKLRATKLNVAMDSIKTLRDSVVAKLDQKIESLKKNTIGKLNSLDVPPEVQSKISSATGNVENFKIPGSELNLQSLNRTSDISVPSINNVGLPSDIANVGAVGNLNAQSGALPNVTGKVGSYSTDIKKITNGNLSEVKNLPKAAEEKAGELSGIGEVKQKAGVLDEYKSKAERIKNPDSLKSFAKQEVKQAAINHFAGKEEQLKKAMETISKYKSKYSSINSLADIKKRPPNQMKGKPLIERIIPGIAMQMQSKGEDFMVEFNPYAGYRFTGRLTGGLGWNQRVAYNTDKRLFNPDARIFGPRIFGEFKLWKGFSPRLEGEVMNTKIPPATVSPSVDPAQREWVWGAFIGLKKEYRFFKNVKGTALVMTRLFNPDRKSPYADVLNVRFGFEFPMKKKLANQK